MTDEEAFAQLDSLRNAGFFIICWTPDEIEGLNKSTLRYMEDYLVTKGTDFICDNTPNDDEAPMCAACSGSGEGQYDGSSCRSCGGRGAEPAEKEKEHDPKD